MPATRWGETIQRLLLERKWTKQKLANLAGIRPNTLTNIIKHGRPTDTTTLGRIADAFGVDISEMLLTAEQSLVLDVYRESRVERLREAVMRELSETVTKIVEHELDKAAAPGLAGVKQKESQKVPKRRPNKKPE